MQLNRLVIVGLVGATTLSACSREASEPPQVVPQTPPVAAPQLTGPAISYACDSGQTITVRYPDAATASLAYKGQIYGLRSVPSATGTRYTGSGLEWRTETRAAQETGVLGRIDPDPNLGVGEIERCARPSANPDLPAPGSVPGTPIAPIPSPGGVQPASMPCQVAQLRLTNDSGDAGAGNRVNVFAVTNTGPAACSVAGYPSVSLLNAQGRVLTTVRSDQNPATAMPVSIPAGGKGYFDIAWKVVPERRQWRKGLPLGRPRPRPDPRRYRRPGHTADLHALRRSHPGQSVPIDV